MTVEQYSPVSTLVVPSRKVMQAKYPFIDVHSHQNFLSAPSNRMRLIAQMDSINLRVLVNLSGGFGVNLKKGVEAAEAFPGRLIVFANVDFGNVDDPLFSQKAVDILERDVKNGAKGLKIFRELGLDIKDSKEKRVPVDDERLDPIWKKCGELGIPVLIHSGAPKTFFQPVDKNNERWLELDQFPDRQYPPDKFPTWEQVMTEQHNVFAKHPKTTFIDAHLGWLGGDLEALGNILDKYPNVFTEIGAVLAEIGRQPRFARAWFIKYQDRILFGKDTWGPLDEYRVYFRVLETEDEYFDYYRPRHAFWKMYGMGLPDDVLRKVYYKNALRLFPFIDALGFPK